MADGQQKSVYKNCGLQNYFTHSLDGTFATESAKAHWDLTRKPACRFCGGVDDLRHRLEHCPHHYAIRQAHPRLMRLWHRLPDCQRLHGLCPKVAYRDEYWQALQSLPDLTADFQEFFHEGTAAVNLFVDGACTSADHADLRLAAWAVTTPSAPISCGHLVGIRQTISRAETTAMLSALRWIEAHRLPSHVWTDSQLVYNGLTALMRGEEIDYEDSDLWDQISQIVLRIQGLFTVHKIWSHMPFDWASCAFEEWWISGNSRADQLAGFTNANRSEEFWQLHENFARSHRWARTTTRLCQEYLLTIAEAHPAMTAEDALESQMISDLIMLDDSQQCEHELAALFPEEVLSAVRVSKTALMYGSEIVHSILTWVVSCDQLADTSRGVAFLEMLVGWRLTTGQRLPVQDPHTKRWCRAEDIFASAFPATIAQELAIFRKVLLGSFYDCGCEASVVQVDLRACNVLRKIPGVTLGWPHDLSVKVHKIVTSFFAHRPWRRGVDLARTLEVVQDQEMSYLL